MKLLEASVKAATDSKAAGAEEPVSVADAKKAREKRPAAKKAAAAAKAKAASDATRPRPKPPRRRKSA